MAAVKASAGSNAESLIIILFILIPPFLKYAALHLGYHLQNSIIVYRFQYLGVEWRVFGVEQHILGQIQSKIHVFRLLC